MYLDGVWVLRRARVDCCDASLALDCIDNGIVRLAHAILRAPPVARHRNHAHAKQIPHLRFSSAMFLSVRKADVSRLHVL
jgi:hypothetical protein